MLKALVVVITLLCVFLINSKFAQQGIQKIKQQIRLKAELLAAQPQPQPIDQSLLDNNDQPGLPEIWDRMMPSMSIKNCEYDICEEVDDYPDVKLLNSLVDKEPTLKTYFGNITQPYKEIVRNRMGVDGPEGLCVSRTITKTPKYMRNIDGVQHHVFNTDQYTQTITFEVCDKPGSACCPSGGLNQSTRCVQKYTVMRLLVVGNNQTLDYSRFRIPITCICSLEKDA